EVTQFERYKRELLGLEPANDLADEAALDAVGLTENEGAVFTHEPGRLRPPTSSSKTGAYEPGESGRSQTSPMRADRENPLASSMLLVPSTPSTTGGRLSATAPAKSRCASSSMSNHSLCARGTSISRHAGGSSGNSSARSVTSPAIASCVHTRTAYPSVS